MLDPSTLISEMITAIKAVESNGLNDVIEMTEQPANNLRPPYAGIYYDFDNDDAEFTSTKDIISLPVSIYVLLFSSHQKKAVDAFSQLVTISNTIKSAVPGTYTISGKRYTVEWKDKPFTVLAKTADQAVMRLNLQYSDYEV